MYSPRLKENKIRLFRFVTLCRHHQHFREAHLRPQHGDINFLQNAGIFRRVYMMSQLIRTEKLRCDISALQRLID
jgi:hypothetical protein